MRVTSCHSSPRQHRRTSAPLTKPVRLNLRDEPARVTPNQSGPCRATSPCNPDPNITTNPRAPRQASPVLATRRTCAAHLGPARPSMPNQALPAHLDPDYPDRAVASQPQPDRSDRPPLTIAGLLRQALSLHASPWHRDSPRPVKPPAWLRTATIPDGPDLVCPSPCFSTAQRHPVHDSPPPTIHS